MVQTPAQGTPQDRSDEIRRLCEAWRNATGAAGGGLVITGDTESLRLRNNGIEMHTLSHGELRTAGVCLTLELLLPGMNTVIDRDHLLFWSWCAELLAGAHWTYFGKTPEDSELRDLLSVAVRAPLVSLAATEDSDTLLSMNVHLRELATNGHALLANLSFPLLQGVVQSRVITA